MTQNRFPSFVAIFLFSANLSFGALTVNSAQPITERVQVNPIIVSNSAGDMTAPFFGDATQQGIIEGFIDDIWAQAGIDIEFLAPRSYNSDFAFFGDPLDNSPRPLSDLNDIVTQAESELGIISSNPNVLNLFFVQIVPGNSQTGNTTANGLAFVGGNGITQWVGPTLPTFTAGQEVAASVVAHEIGHNLGLSHLAEGENLMLEGGSPNLGERLNSEQITIALNSPFSVSIIPEPSATLLIGLAGFGFLVRRR